jgi:phospholipid/cholesterol/gamma-HCH transport system substrate-binding protein
MKLIQTNKKNMHLSKEVKIALIAIFILLISVWGFNFLKGKNILKPKQEYYVVFDRIDGLIESGIVSYKGYKVGNIAEIKYDLEQSGKFILRISLEEKLYIPKNSVVKIKSTSIIVASNELEIIFSDAGDYHQPGDTLISEANKGISEMLDPLQNKLNSVLNGIDSLLYSLNSILTTGTEQDIRTSIASISAGLASIKEELEPGGSIRETLGSLESISSTIESKGPQISSSIDHLAGVTADLDSADLDRTIKSLDSTLIALQGILVKIDEGSGTMGKLVNDSSLYANLDSTSYHLSELMKDMKEHPKRYVHFSLFGKKDR